MEAVSDSSENHEVRVGGKVFFPEDMQGAGGGKVFHLPAFFDSKSNAKGKIASIVKKIKETPASISDDRVTFDFGPVKITLKMSDSNRALYESNHYDFSVECYFQEEESEMAWKWVDSFFVALGEAGII